MACLGSRTASISSRPQRWTSFPGRFYRLLAGQRRIHADRICRDFGGFRCRADDSRLRQSRKSQCDPEPLRWMLADFLRLQIICTINCSAADIDPALLRPGRLLCHRVLAGSTTPKPPAWPGVLAGNCHKPMITPLLKCLPDRTPMKLAAAHWICGMINMKTKKSGIVEELKEKHKERLAQAQQELKKEWQRREQTPIAISRMF